MSIPVNDDLVGMGFEINRLSGPEDLTANAEDAALFQQDVFGSTKESGSFADTIIDKFSSYSKEVGEKKEVFEAALEKASYTGNPEDVISATKAMGDYQLQVLLSTKVASKATQAIDKITNLQ